MRELAVVYKCVQRTLGVIEAVRGAEAVRVIRRGAEREGARPQLEELAAQRLPQSARGGAVDGDAARPHRIRRRGRGPVFDSGCVRIDLYDYRVFTKRCERGVDGTQVVADGGVVREAAGVSDAVEELGALGAAQLVVSAEACVTRDGVVRPRIDGDGAIADVNFNFAARKSCGAGGHVRRLGESGKGFRLQTRCERARVDDEAEERVRANGEAPRRRTVVHHRRHGAPAERHAGPIQKRMQERFRLPHALRAGVPLRQARGVALRHGLVRAAEVVIGEFAGHDGKLVANAVPRIRRDVDCVGRERIEVRH
mmetsp:Transcript_10869/g.36267  ORF Transcript_10869/g.36267 Transcript_10869/m.36267 type:complete len:311 (+) Transcript_10869:165-1097(+)